MAANSTAKARPSKPAKPYPDFPLGAHASGRWCKRINGKLYYFGKWDDPDAALQKYLVAKEDLYAGRTPRPKTCGLTIRDLANRFLTYKQGMLDSDEIATRTFRDYHASCGRLVEFFGKDRLVLDLEPSDFEKLRVNLASGRASVALSNEVGRIRVCFNYAVDSLLIDRPVHFGKSFHKPTRKVLRLERARRTKEHGKRMFEPHELRQMIDAASPAMRAMLLLGCNCALGQSDCANLPISAVDLERGWLDFPRPKTGIERKCRLWPETVAAIRTAIAARPRTIDPDNSDLIFVTKYGRKWVRTSDKSAIDSVSQEFRKLLRNLGINGKRGFYAIRHGFQTIAEESRDMPAVRQIMGHCDDSMSAAYREGIADGRLEAVTDGIHRWLFPEGGNDE